MSADAATGGDGVDLTYGDLRVRVLGDRGHLQWLEEFLTPHFGRRAGEPDCQVFVNEDEEQFAALRLSGPHADSGLLDCFALDSSVVRLPVWRASEGTTTIFDEKFDVFYSLNADDPRTVTLITRRHNLGARVAMMRVVRELTMNHVQRIGGLFLHAAALAVRGRGVVIAGQRAAGKTTLLIHLLRHPGARYVSNDRALVSFHPATVALRGMPTIVTVRPRTLALFPSLRERLLASGYHPRLSLAEVAAAPLQTPRPWGDQRFGLSPAQFRALLATEAVADCQLSTLLLPRITNQPGTVRLTELSPEVAAERLSLALFGAGSWRKSSDVFTVPDQPPPPDETELARRCSRLTSQVRCVECALGLEAYERAELAGELLDEVLAA